MPKKFTNENPKVTAARDRKAEVKKTDAEKKQKAAEDSYWADDNKLANRKLQRKDEAESKRSDALKRKEENRKLAEEEMNKLSGKSTAGAQKVTRHEIDRQREAAILAKLQEERKKQQEAQKIEVIEHIEENLNKLNVDSESARNVDEAINVLVGNEEDFDKHPEKRMRAAYIAFEEKRMPQLKAEHPTFRLSQLKQILRKEWMKSPENPLNQKLADLTRCGVKFPHNQLLTSSTIVDDDFLRIVQMELPSSTRPRMTIDEIESLRSDCILLHKEIQKDYNRALLHDMYTRMTQVDFFQQKLQEYPELNQHPQAVPYVADPLLLFTALANPTCARLCIKDPILLHIIKGILDSVPFQRFRPPGGLHQILQQQQQLNQPAITADFLQQAINFAMGNVAAAPAQVPTQAVAPIPQNNPLEEAKRRYASELMQMREFGFMDDELNITILMQCQGNVATAMEILIDANP